MEIALRERDMALKEQHLQLDQQKFEPGEQEEPTTAPNSRLGMHSS